MALQRPDRLGQCNEFRFSRPPRGPEHSVHELLKSVLVHARVLTNHSLSVVEISTFNHARSFKGRVRLCFVYVPYDVC